MSAPPTTLNNPATSTADPQSDVDVIALYPKVRKPRSTDSVEFVHPESEHGPAINALINKVFGGHRSQAQFDWKYWDNPAGPPVGTLAWDSASGRCLATGLGHRRQASIDGEDSCGALLCEVASDPDVPDGGKLWRNAMYGFSIYSNDVDGLYWAFGGQSTDDAITVGSRWFGYRVIFELVPWEFRLSTRASLTRRVGKWGAWVIPFVVPLCDIALRMIWRKRDFGLTTTEISEFSCEYDELWERYRNKYPVCFFRDAETLNWRYVANPLWKHRIVEARRDGKLVGYIVWREADHDGCLVATVLDFWHGDDMEVMQTLLDVARRKARRNQCVSLRFALKEGTPGHEALKTFFTCRRSPHESVDKIICTPIPGSHPKQQDPKVYELLRTVLKGRNWFYTQGDCDFHD